MDAASRDDAAVLRIAPDRALIATVDFFTPIVDDPATWGAFTAANARSEIYAMGGKPLFCLSLVGWPREKLPFDLLGEALGGAARVLEGAGCLILGGHSVDDPEPKLGFAVIGEAHPDRLLTNTGGQPGDLLVLTKPLGTGILTTAFKRSLVDESGLAQAVATMITLNDTAARLAIAHGARAATDVTGFGLLGHLGNILAGSKLGADLWVESLPLLDGALELASQGIAPGGTERNLESSPAVFDADVSQAERLLTADAQTSGGMLVALAPDAVDGYVAALGAGGVTTAAVVGRLTAEFGLRVHRRAG